MSVLNSKITVFLILLNAVLFILETKVSIIAIGHRCFFILEYVTCFSICKPCIRLGRMWNMYSDQLSF